MVRRSRCLRMVGRSTHITHPWRILADMIFTLVSSVFALLVGFTFGAFLNHGHRTHRTRLLWTSAVAVVGGLLLLQVIHADTWTFVGYASGLMLSFPFGADIIDRSPIGRASTPGDADN